MSKAVGKSASSILDVIKVASPCMADWNKMEGDGRARHCMRCQLNVYNISEMNLREAEKLIQEKEGRLCVRYYCRLDGTILTKDCPIGIRALEKIRRGAILVLVGFAGIFFGIHAKDFINVLFSTSSTGNIFS